MKKIFFLLVSLICFLSAQAGAQEAYTTAVATANQLTVIKDAPQSQGFVTKTKPLAVQSWNETTVATYASGTKVAFTPMMSAYNQSKQLLSVFSSESEVNQFILEIKKVPGPQVKDETFSGTIKLFTLDGQLLSSASYRKNVRTSLQETAQGKIKLPSGFNARIRWFKVASCLKEIYDSKLGRVCVSQCVSCFQSPGMVNCGICAICLLVSLSLCINR